MVNQLKGGGRKPKLTLKQRVFVNELMVDMNGTRAAAAAGYKSPAVVACFLQDARRYPLVVQAIREASARKELAAERKADEILKYIHTVLFCCPADYFDPGGNGGWSISQEDYRRLPSEIKCLIEEMKLRTVKTKSGTVNTLWVRLVSKERALVLAAKHQLGQKMDLQTHLANWDLLAQQIPDTGAGPARMDECQPSSNRNGTGGFSR